jgi:peroxiredoxin Q/BCP
MTTTTAATIPVAGAPAPAFTALTDAGIALSLAELRGRPVVLYFYPKDDTPSCTTEACGFRNAFPRFEALDAVVLGVSPDTPKSHAKFRAKHGLPFTLVADVDHAIADAYGVWQEKSMYGRKYMGVVRTTFLVDADGTVVRVWEKVKSSGHAEEVARVLESLGAA